MIRFYILLTTIMLLFTSTFADDFYLDQEKRKNPTIFEAKPENLTKEQLVYRTKTDEKGLSQYARKITTLKGELRTLQSKVASVNSENKKLRDDRDTYIEKIEKLSMRLEELENILTVEPSEQKDIHAAYKRLQQEYKRLELSSSLKGDGGYKSLQLEKENALLKKQLNAILRELNRVPEPRAFVGNVGIVE